MRALRVILVTIASLALAAVLSAAAITPVLRSRRDAASATRLRVEQAIAEYQDLIRRHPEWVEAPSRWELASYSRLSSMRQNRRLSEFMRSLDDLRSLMVVRADGEDTYRTFSPTGFRDFYDGFSYPNVQPATTPASITGDERADQHIRRVAETRGYRMRPVAVEDLLVSRGKHRLQAPVWDAWDALRVAAAEDGVSLDVVSAYRSPEHQQDIFLRRLLSEAATALGRTVGAEDFVSGGVDPLLEEILATSSIPGYSKHHSGYTLDITDTSSGLPFSDFGKTEGFLWISANNYQNAKRFGFIPSYPQGAIKLGPDPEPWEYVWVGERILVESRGPTPVGQSWRGSGARRIAMWGMSASMNCGPYSLKPSLL